MGSDEISDDETGNGWERDFQQLRKRYQQTLRRDLSTLGVHLRGARNGERGELESAHQLAHRLKGTSGSYGFEETSEALQRIEDRLEEMLDAPAIEPPPPRAKSWDAIDAELERAAAALD